MVTLTQPVGAQMLSVSTAWLMSKGLAQGGEASSGSQQTPPVFPSMGSAGVSPVSVAGSASAVVSGAASVVSGTAAAVSFILVSSSSDGCL
jgi:hypothetical protein